MNPPSRRVTSCIRSRHGKVTAVLECGHTVTSQRWMTVGSKVGCQMCAGRDVGAEAGPDDHELEK